MVQPTRSNKGTFAAELEAARQRMVELARSRGAVLCAYALRDEITGNPITFAAAHHQWHRTWDTQKRSIIYSHVELGKTAQVTGRILYELGNDPSLRIAYVSNTKDLARKVGASVLKYIDTSPEVREVFPKLRRGAPPSPWHAEAMTVRRKGIAKDPSLQVSGAHGNVIGSRIDLLIIDDIQDYENTSTAHARDGLYLWIKSLFGRLTARGRVWVVGNVWHPKDAIHQLEASGGYHVARYPVVSSTGELTWPERWPQSRIDAARIDLGPLEFSRQLMCLARDDAAAHFRREWLDASCEKGADCALYDSYEALLLDSGESLDVQAIVHGVDLAVQQKDDSDSSAIVSVAVLPGGMRRLIAIESGKWTGPEILSRIEGVYARWGGVVICENVGAQDYILQFVRDRSALPIIPFTTGKNKANPEFGVASLAVEFANGKWQLPSRGGKLHPEVSALLSEMLYYDPRSHTGDRLMGTWFAREGIRKLLGEGSSVSIGRVGLRTLG